MSCAAQVVTAGGPPNLGELAASRAARLERMWSRFLPESEVSNLNRSPGRPVLVSPETFKLIAHGVDAWQRTAGRFDPTVYDAVVAAGYERSYESLPMYTRGDVAVGRRAPGCDRIVLDPELSAVTLPEGVRFDPGGIGKGLAADVILDELLGAGADAALVNIGGDLRCGGDPEAVAGGWTIEVAQPDAPNTDLATLVVTDGAVATSSRLTRTWHIGEHLMHHIIDPSTGLPADSSITAVTVVAATAWWAEAVTKAVFDCGPHEALARIRHWAAEGLVVTESGDVLTTFEPASEGVHT